MNRALPALIGLGMLGLSAAAAAEETGTLRVGRAELPPSLGNPFTTVGQPSSGVWTALYDGLTMIGEDGSLEPALATGWQAETPTRWVFRLRDGVSYQDGSAFDAKDVLAIVAFLQSEIGKTTYTAAEVAGIVSATARDPLTVEFETAEPDALLPQRFNIVFFPEPGAIQRDGLDGLAMQPVGTGPFRLKDWGRTTGTTKLDAVPDSWRAPAAVAALRLVHIADAAGRLGALMSDQLDIVEGIGPDDAMMLRGRDIRIEKRPVPAVSAIAFRVVGNDGTPLSDPTVRVALNHAVDKASIAEVILGGESEAMGQGASPITFGYNPDLQPLAFDPEKARALLAEAGYPDGFEMQIEVLVGLGANDALIYQKVAQDLRAAGIAVTLRTPPFPSWLQKFTSGDWGDVDAFSFLWDSSAYNDVSRPIRNYSCQKPQPFFCDPALMPLIEASSREMDPESRAGMLREIMARMQADPPSLYLVSAKASYAVSNRIAEFHARPHGIMYERIGFR